MECLVTLSLNRWRFIRLTFCTRLLGDGVPNDVHPLTLALSHDGERERNQHPATTNSRRPAVGNVAGSGDACHNKDARGSARDVCHKGEGDFVRRALCSITTFVVVL